MKCLTDKSLPFICTLRQVVAKLHNLEVKHRCNIMISSFIINIHTKNSLSSIAFGYSLISIVHKNLI